jgi:hypothetical protein
MDLEHLIEKLIDIQKIVHSKGDYSCVEFMLVDEDGNHLDIENITIWDSNIIKIDLAKNGYY